MDKIIRSALLTLLIAAPVAAGAQAVAAFGQSSTGFHGGNGLGSVVGTCGVTDVAAFEVFVGGKPTAAEFRAAYGCLQLVMPGDITTKEIRSNNSRYFAQVDKFGRIVGGQFQ
jgi:hypothetical protein